MKHKVAIVDDHSLLSMAIGELINNFNEFETVGIFKNGKEIVNALDSESINPRIILMDVNMPILNGIEATKIISEKYPEISVLALSVEENEQTIIEMLKSGAKGYLSKDIPSETLLKALKTTIEKGFYYTPEVNSALMGNLNRKDDSENLEDLKEREIEFIKLACSDLTYKEIADQMFLSPKTIDNYRDSVFSKLNLKNRVGLVLFAIKHKIYNVDKN